MVWRLGRESVNDRGMWSAGELAKGFWGENGLMPVDYLKTGAGFPYLPEQPVAPGSTWKDEVQVARISMADGLREGMVVEIEWKYSELADYEGRKCAIIKFAGLGRKQSEAQGLEERVELSGKWHFDVEERLDARVSYSVKTYYWMVEEQKVKPGSLQWFSVEKMLSDVVLRPDEQVR